MNFLIPKIEYIEDPKHVSFSHQLGCVICGNPECHFHHLMRGKTRRGQHRAGDNEGLPLCPAHHNIGKQSLHLSGMNEREYFRLHGIEDPVALATALHQNSGNYAVCMSLIEQAKSRLSGAPPHP